MNGKTVIVGMSGGVDSSVAAFLLKEQGYNVIGVTMRHFDLPTEAGAEGFAKDAKKVCDNLGIPHYVLDFREEFRQHVINNFVGEYIEGRTPNPCLRCNRYVKWEALLSRCRDFGADYVATGHYAKIKQLESGRLAVMRAESDKKDQSYALYALTQEQLRATLFPLGDYEKTRVREIAAGIGLSVAEKKDSQEICFIPDNDYGRFIREAGVLVPPAGEFVYKTGKVLGTHKGIHQYTIGQRKGLGIAAENPLFVYDIDPAENRVYLGDAEDVFGSTLICKELSYMGVQEFTDGERFTAKIRYGASPVGCSVTGLQNGLVKVDFDEPVRAATPGQAVVFYRDDYVAAGGVITK